METPWRRKRGLNQEFRDKETEVRGEGVSFLWLLQRTLTNSGLGKHIYYLIVLQVRSPEWVLGARGKGWAERHSFLGLGVWGGSFLRFSSSQGPPASLGPRPLLPLQSAFLQSLLIFRPPLTLALLPSSCKDPLITVDHWHHQRLSSHL